MCTKVLVILGGDLDTELVPLYRRRLSVMRSRQHGDFLLRG